MQFATDLGNENALSIPPIVTFLSIAKTINHYFHQMIMIQDTMTQYLLPNCVESLYFQREITNLLPKLYNTANHRNGACNPFLPREFVSLHQMMFTGQVVCVYP